MATTGKLNQLLIDKIVDVPTFLVKPRQQLAALFGATYRPGAGVAAGVQYLILGLAIFYGGGLARGLQVTHLNYLFIGSALTWVLYGLFMHAFVRIWGGRQGFMRTIDAYAYTIGILQPVLAFVLLALSYIFPINARWDIIQQSLGMSGSAEEVAHWIYKGLPEYGVLSFHMISAALIASYLSVAFSVAQAIRLWQSIGAMLTSFVFFLILYAVVGLLVLIDVLPERLIIWGGT